MSPKRRTDIRFFENRLRSCPILPSVPHSGRYRDRSMGMAKQRPRASTWRSPTWRLPHSMPGTQESPPASAAYPGTPDCTALASSGLSFFETSIAPAAFRSGLPSRSGPASFRNIRCDRRKPVTHHALLLKGAENAYSRPQALRSASARPVASQVNSGSSRPKWP